MSGITNKTVYLFLKNLHECFLHICSFFRSPFLHRKCNKVVCVSVFAMASDSGAMESQWRVYIENIMFNVSKGVLSSTIARLCGVVDPPIKVIRKASAMHSICSAIITCEDENQMNDMIRVLNEVPTIHLAHILGHGKVSLNAKQAYIPGARLVSWAPTAIPPPPKVSVHTLPPPVAPRAFPPTPPPVPFFESHHPVPPTYVYSRSTCFNISTSTQKFRGIVQATQSTISAST